MIRALILALGLLTGLVAAVGMAGQLSHARWALGAHLPDWTEALAADSSLLAGQGRVSQANLRWQFDGIDGGGPHWRVALSGADWQVTGRLRFGGGGVVVDEVRGLIPGALLQADGRGAFTLEAGHLRLAVPDGRILAGQVQGQARGLTLDGAVLDGAQTLQVTGDDWRVQP